MYKKGKTFKNAKYKKIEKAQKVQKILIGCQLLVQKN